MPWILRDDLGRAQFGEHDEYHAEDDVDHPNREELDRLADAVRRIQRL